MPYVVFRLKLTPPYIIGDNQFTHGMGILGRQNLRGQVSFAFGIERLDAEIADLQNIRGLGDYLHFNHVDGHQTVVADVERVGEVNVLRRVLPFQGLLIQSALKGFFHHGIFQRLKGGRVLGG